MNLLHETVHLLCRFRRGLLLACVSVFMFAPSQAGDEKPRWIMGKAAHIPSEYTNQESGYFSIIEGKNGNIYIGSAKYGVNAYLIEFNPRNAVMQMVVDVHRAIGKFLKGFAAQAKIHTRNNLGQLTGKIYFASKQGYPEKGEKRSDYPGGYVFAYDPKTGKTENFGMPKEHHGVISVMPDEARGLIYVSTCDDGRPLESSHFMVCNVKTKKYRDLGETQHSYAFIVLDHKGRALHPVRGGKIARFDADADKLEKLDVTVDGQPPPKDIYKDGAILNWDQSPRWQDAVVRRNVDQPALLVRCHRRGRDPGGQAPRPPAGRRQGHGLPGTGGGAQERQGLDVHEVRSYDVTVEEAKQAGTLSIRQARDTHNVFRIDEQRLPVIMWMLDHHGMFARWELGIKAGLSVVTILRDLYGILIGCMRRVDRSQCLTEVLHRRGQCVVRSAKTSEQCIATNGRNYFGTKRCGLDNLGRERRIGVCQS